jgi:hypothetical protein
VTETQDGADVLDPAREGLAHLQAAAREMIAAARSMLDAVEELIDDPKAADSIAGAVGTIGRLVEGAVASVVAPRVTEPSDDDSRVQRIRVS